MRLQELLKEWNLEDIFNADETCLYWRAAPTVTYSVGSAKESGQKLAKDRITALICCNAMGEKRKLLVIGRNLVLLMQLTFFSGKSRNPTSFRRRGKKIVDGDLAMKNQLPVQYEWNDNAWMTSKIWSHWIKNWDDELGQSSPPRKILLLVDNFSGHTVNPEIACELKNITLEFLPPNTTSHIQPLDAGIIKTLKAKYRHDLIGAWLEELERLLPNEAPGTDLLKAVEMLAQAWDDMPEQTIRNCFAHTGLFSKDMEACLRGTELLNENDTIRNLTRVINLLHVSETANKLSADAYLGLEDDLVTIEGEDTENLDEIIATVSSFTSFSYNFEFV